MEKKVILYNSDNMKIGETFVRRARQLVKQQRAVWTDDRQDAIRFAPGAENLDEPAEDIEPLKHSDITPVPDKRLMKLARQRVIMRTVFKGLCALYVVVNIFLVGVWFFTSGGGNAIGHLSGTTNIWSGTMRFFSASGHFWPGWVMAGWGLALVIVGIVFRALSSVPKDFDDKVNDEYRKLK
ncbi:MAG: 2TM domain-containing protein [Defluviitaleaceae bacterium]|nr:2TM domain-containing protein [Defluviitaleaceae bacterium]